MTEQEWKTKFKEQFKKYCFGPHWSDAEKENIAQQHADVSWPDYRDEDPNECADSEAREAMSP